MDTPWCNHDGKHGYYNSESNRAYWYCPTCGRIGEDHEFVRFHEGLENEYQTVGRLGDGRGAH